MRRSQVANEFVFLLGITMLIMLVTLYVVSDEISTLAYGKESDTLKDIGYMVQNELYLAGMVNDGYQRTFVIPASYYGYSYTVDISGSTLFINSTKRKIMHEFSVPAAVGSPVLGDNRISKEGGVVYLN